MQILIYRTIEVDWGFIREENTVITFAFLLSLILSKRAILLSITHPERRNTTVALCTMELILGTGSLLRGHSAG